jgi:Fe-S-cluster formation regulator IscX/YfhJ
MRYLVAMTQPAPLIEDDEAAAEARALAAAIAESDADPRTVPHEDVRAWLLRLAQGEFDAPPPEPR